jgi:predicted ATPase with chaperone activity
MAAAFSIEDFTLDLAKAGRKKGPDSRPNTLAEIDIRPAILEDLALKTLYASGSMSVLELSEKLCVAYEIANELFSSLRTSRCCQVTGMAGTIPQIAITSEGRNRAADLFSQSHYVGAAPVSFESYKKQVRLQSAAQQDVHMPDVERAFAHLVLEKETLRQLGTALNSGTSLFLYGPPGTGKTTIAEVLSTVLAQDDVWIPQAIEIDGQIITIFDQTVHKPTSQSQSNSHDRRSVRCQRPAVLVGGELSPEMLDLQFNPISKYYEGPVQLKANNGVMIIDDFGRQRMRPEEILNRWIVPLDRKLDYMSMSGGKKIEVPFEMLVVFASNFDPADLVDPAFIRRIKTKIKIGGVSSKQFVEIFCRVAQEKKVHFDQGIPEELMGFIREVLHQELRACHPRDIIDQVCWAARFDNKEPHIDLAALDQAINAYFVMGPGKSAATPS